MAFEVGIVGAGGEREGVQLVLRHLRFRGDGLKVSSSSLLLSILELSDTEVYEPYLQALLGTAA